MHIKTGKIVAIKVVEAESLTEVSKEIEFLKSSTSQYVVRYFGSYLKGDELWVHFPSLLMLISTLTSV